MGRKGKLSEVFSKALHADDATLYTVSYRDFERIKEIGLPKFVKLSENFQAIPQNRVVYVKKGDQVLYRKTGF